MIDELDVLERYLAETPHPTADALEDVRQELTIAIAEPTAQDGRARLPRRGVSPLQRVALVAAAIVVIAGVTVPLLTSTSGRTTPPTKAPSWHLTGDIAQPEWQIEGSNGSGSYELVCPSVSDCYASEPSIPPNGQGLPTGIIEVSHDGGRTWGVGLSAPAVDLYGLTCPNATTCMTAGEDFASGSEQALLYTTSDGGGTWQHTPLGSSLSSPALSCPSASHCVATLDVPGPGGQGIVTDAAVTDDGGAHWTTTAMGNNLQAPDLQCVGQTCVAAGISSPAGRITSPSQLAAAMVYSDDGGRSWSKSEIPSADMVESISCADAEHCMAIEHTMTQTGSTGLSGPALSTVIATSDGGKTWATTAGNEPDQWFLANLTCATALECWLTGFVHAPGLSQQQLFANEQTPPEFMKVTDNGGQTWSTVTLPDVDGAPITQIGVTSCATVQACFALVQDPSSTGTAPSPALTQRQLVLATDPSSS